MKKKIKFIVTISVASILSIFVTFCCSQHLHNAKKFDRKVKSEKAQKLKEDFTIRAFLQLIILAAIPFGWLNFILRLAC